MTESDPPSDSEPTPEQAPATEEAPEIVGGPVGEAPQDPGGEPKTDPGSPPEKPADAEAISPIAVAIFVVILAVLIYNFTGGGGSDGPELPEESNPAKLLTEGNRIAASEGLKEALAYFVKAVKVDPANLEAQAALGNALLRLNRAEEAQGYLQHCAEREPERFSFQLRYGMCLAELRKFKQARSYLERAHDLKPDALDPLYPLGLVCMFSQDHKGAVRFLEPFVAQSKHPGQKAVALQWLSDAFERLGQRTSAIAALTSLTVLRPNDAPPRLALQRHRIGEEGFGPTRDRAEKRAAGKDASPLDAYLFGTILASDPDRSQEARGWFEKAVKGGDKAWLAPRISLAQELSRAGAIDEARKQLDGVLKLAPNNLPAKVLAAELERQAKRYPQARTEYEAILTTALSGKAHRGIIDTFLDEGKGKEALAFARRAPEGDPRLLLEGEIRQALGEFEQAETVFQSLIKRAEKAPGLKASWLGYLSYVHLDAGAFDKARNVFSTMEALLPKTAQLPVEYFIWAGVAFQPVDLKRARAYWRRGAATKRDYDHHAWKRRACERLLGKGTVASLRSAVRLAGWETLNDALFLEGLALKLSGDSAGARKVWTEGAAASRRSEFPARLIQRALKKP